jgi:hypothetical protein
MHDDLHPSDQELLLAADGELSARRTARVHAHLGACWRCRTRMGDIQAGIAEFTEAYRDSEPSFPPSEGPRALLKARLEEMRRPKSSFALRFAVAALATLVISLAAIAGLELRTRLGTRANYEAPATPKSSLTPGAIRIVTREEVCSAAMAERAPLVPVSLRRRVFEEYGMPQDNAGMFEVDYLVTPELGGAQDIRNLWPQPYAATVWNAHVKDALEERLHEMVCSGQIDLATAQHDIARDWISAYKKYFHTDRPL